MHDGDTGQLMAEIRSAIMSGDLTRKEIERRLTAAIDAEVEKTGDEVDVSLLKSCINLRYEIETGGQDFSPDREKDLAKIFNRADQHTRRQRTKKGVYRISMMAAALVVLVIGVEVLINFEWLKGDSTRDEQQYAVIGREIDPEIIETGRAAMNEDRDRIKTDSLEDVVSFLGYQPALPTWLPDGIFVKQYYIVNVERVTRMTVTYGNSDTGGGLLLFDSHVYPAVEDAHMMFEQNETGDSFNTGTYTVYYTENVDRLTCTWLNGKTINRVSGFATLDDMTNLIESMEGNE